MAGGEAMGKLMIKCPETGRLVPIDMSMRRVSFERPTEVSENNTLENCPACGKDHVWAQWNTFLQED